MELGVVLVGRDPGTGRVPFQQETARVASREKPVRLPGNGVPLAVVGAVNPVVVFRIVPEETRGKSGAPTNGVVRSRGKAHHVGALGGVVEVDVADLAGFGILHGQGAVGQVARRDALAVRKVPVEESLATRDNRFFVLLFKNPDGASHALIKFKPVRVTVAGMPVYLTVQVAVDVAAPVDAFAFR